MITLLYGNKFFEEHTDASDDNIFSYNTGTVLNKMYKLVSPIPDDLTIIGVIRCYDVSVYDNDRWSIVKTLCTTIEEVLELVQSSIDKDSRISDTIKILATNRAVLQYESGIRIVDMEECNEELIMDDDVQEMEALVSTDLIKEIERILLEDLKKFFDTIAL